MIHTAHLQVATAHGDAFEARLERHAAASLGEPGCLRFDVYRDRETPTRFWLHEVYTDQAALDTHRQSAHFLAFRADVDGWVTGRQWWFWNPVTG